MPDDLLRRRSALTSLYREESRGEAPGIILAERRAPMILELRTWDDAGTIAGLTLPPANMAATTDGIAALSIGPRRWLLVGTSLADRLRRVEAALVDQSHGRTIIRVAGPRMRDLLAKGTGIDLASFAKDSVAATLLGHVSVVLHGTGKDEVDIYCPRSSALALWEWLLHGAEEYGWRVDQRS